MAVNDEVMNNLAQYEGGSLNERIYNFLGNLGYTGTLSDRLSKYSSEGRKGWQGLLEDLGIWTPAQLFSQGQQGLFFTPKPVTFGSQALYQLDNGTTLTDAHGDPVGLGLEWSKGLELGPELADTATPKMNGTATPANKDPATGEWEIERIDFSNQSYAQIEGLDLSSKYRVDIENTGNDNITVRVNNLTTVVIILGPGESATLFPSIESVGNLSVAMAAAGMGYFLIHSVKELPGNHLTQSVSADRPTYNTDGSLHWLEGDGVGDHLIIPDSSFVFAESQYFSIAFSQVASEQSRYLFGGSSDTYFGLILNSGVLRPYVSTDSGTVAFNSQSIVSGTNYVATLIWDKPAQELILRLNGAEIGRSSAPGTGITNGASFSLLGRGGTTNTANARVYGAVKASYLPSAQQFQDVENYLANLAGITL